MIRKCLGIINKRKFNKIFLKPRLNNNYINNLSFKIEPPKKFENLIIKLYKKTKKIFKKDKKLKKFYKKIHHGRQYFIIGSITYLLLVGLFYYEVLKEKNKISIKEFMDLLEHKDIRNIVIQKKYLDSDVYFYEAIIKTIDGRTLYFNIKDYNKFIERISKFNITFHKRNYHNNLSYYLMQVNENYKHFVNFYLIFGMALMVFQMLKMRKSISGSGDKFKKYENIKIKFKDMAGAEEAKLEIKEYVDFLQNSEKYFKMGAKIPKGALLVGPPGTGKTLLAKACAGEANVPFYSTSGSEFVEGFVGVGARKIRSLFKEARKNSPSIIFIDELDAIGTKRGEGSQGEKDNTLNQILVEMDGFGSDSKVIVFGATNLPDALDSALTRAGRFDRQIQMELPNKGARKSILEVHLRKIKIKKKNMEELKEQFANLTPGFSGADLENLCNEASIFAARENASYVTEKHFEKSLDRIIGGIETFVKISEKHKNIISIYEGGKAIASWYLKTAAPVIKVSLIQRSKKQKKSQYLNKDKSLQTKDELIDKIAFQIAGKIAEEEILGESSTRSQDDLIRAYEIAQKMVTKLGMSEEIGFTHLKDDNYKSYSKETNDLIDQEAMKIIKEAEDIIKGIIKEHKDELSQFRDKLIEKESLNHKDIIEIFGERKEYEDESYKNYLEGINKKK